MSVEWPTWRLVRFICHVSNVTIIRPCRRSLGRKRPRVIKHFFQPSVGLSHCPVHCGKTADQIWMRFGMVGQMAPGMRQVVGFGDWSTGGANVGRPIVTNEEFAALCGLFTNYFGQYCYSVLNCT